MRTTTMIVGATLLVGLLVSGAAGAEDEWTYLSTSETLETIELADGVVANVVAQKGFAVFDDASHRLHMSNQDCYGTFVTNPEGVVSSGYCTLVPTSNDGGFWAAWEGDQSGGTWHVMRSGGSLAGITGKGTFGAPTAQWPDGKAAVRIKGNIEMP